MQEQPVETTLYSLYEGAPQPVERRDDERHLTLFRVGSINVGDRRELCLIKNISSGGMMIRAYCPLEADQRVSIELKRGEQISGKVLWVNSGSAGIEFEKRIDIVELLATSMDGPRPRMPRVEIRCIASIRQGSQVYGMRVHDISQGGLKVESNSDLVIGSDVAVAIPGLRPQQGVVRWKDGRCYGITFSRLLALNELVEWLQSQRELLRTAS